MIALAAPTTTEFAPQDWAKVSLVLAGRWPRPLPPQTIAHRAFDVVAWARTIEGAPRVAVDVEGTDSPTAIGLAAPNGKTTLLIDWPAVDTANRMSIANVLSALFLFVPVVGHWVARDVALLQREGVQFDRIDDSGVLHAVRHPGQPHSLVHACSTYGQWVWSKGTPRHTQGDVLGALDVFYGVERAMPPSAMVEGVELNPLRRRYEFHRTVTLPEAIRLWAAGRECNYRYSVDPTWAPKLEAA